MLNAQLQARVESLLGEPIISVRETKGGYTPALRRVCQTPSRAVFLKVGTDDFTVPATNREIQLYTQLKLPCMPRVVGYEASDDSPIRILEDLSSCHWPLPWEPGQLDRAVQAIRRLHAAPNPPGVLKPETFPADGWAKVRDNPGLLCETGLVDAHWLEGALPRLLEAERACVVAGSELTHYDLRSDNLCFQGDRVVVIDWSWACLGSGRLDLAFFLNSVTSEGGPAQETYLGEAPHEAAVVSGFFAHQFTQPELPGAPHVRRVQRQQFCGALPWVSRALGLPKPGSAS